VHSTAQIPRVIRFFLFVAHARALHFECIIARAAGVARAMRSAGATISARVAWMRDAQHGILRARLFARPARGLASFD
jgi:hypothetical protein